MGSQKTKTKTQETATTTPNLPGAAAPAVNDYFSGVQNLMQTPGALMTPANDLQRSAQSQILAAPADVMTPAISGVNGAMGMLAGVGPAALSQASAPTSYSPVQATAATAGLPAAYTPAQAQAASYGNVAQAQLPGLPGVERVDTSGITGGLYATGYGGARARDYMGDYASPYLQQVISATEADLANSQGADRAAYARRAGMMGAFGGSRYGLGETNLIDSQNRTRNTMAATLRDQGWQRALEAGQSDAGNINAAGIASMQSANDMAGRRAEIDARGLFANQDAANEMARLGYTTGAETSRFNTGLLADAQGRQFDAANQIGMFNTGQANDAAGRIYSTTADNAQFNAGQANSVNLANAGFANDAAGRIYSTQADLGQFNAGQANQNAQFNQSLGLDRAQTAGQLSTALGGLLSDQAGYNLDRIGAMGSLGNDQRLIDMYNSPAGQQALLAELLSGGGLLGTATGQTINSSGTRTSKQSGGLLSSILGGAFGLGSAALGGR